jgi:SOS response regulatory protein OraA/RecX
MTAALAMLARRDYSRAKLEQRLLTKEFTPAVASEVVARCIDAGYVDDRRYGRARVESRLGRRPGGQRDAIADLQRQGLAKTMSEGIVEEVFAAAGGEEAVLDDALGRWRAKHGEPTELAAAKRCFDHLMRRRFPRYLILQALSPWLDNLYD